MERFADSETGTSFTPRREAVRDPSAAFALLISLLRNCANGVVALCASEENSTLTLPSPATAAGEGQNRSGGEDDRLESLSYIRPIGDGSSALRQFLPCRVAVPA